ncbi:O-antigen ligase family protein [Aureimonas populi]|uniref:O-antigen ligase family protein n=1 Tax=Aureimonas populi TaxID=1701758 RepID=A0ABW5CR81_9HYPH|nr:O-antigen ligase family protein [Aureimonas populi]
MGAPVTIRRALLLRRHIDPWLLAAGFGFLALLQGPGKVIFLVFAACGFYLALARHRTCRHLPPVYTAVLISYCLWGVILSLGRGEPMDGNRLLGYAAIQLAAVFLPVGLCLVRRPVDAMVLGCRVAVVVLLGATTVEWFMTGERVGLGRNEAILGFVIAAAALIARMQADFPPRFVPNGRWWSYVALLPVLLTQTRAAWIVFVPLIVFDLWAVVRERSGGRPPMAAMAVAAIAMAVAAVPIWKIVTARVVDGMAEIANLRETGVASGSMDVRLVMWNHAAELISEHPLLGVGPTQRMARVAEAAGAENAALIGSYTHLHNLFIDEALSSGLVGLALMLAVFATFLVAVFRARSPTLTKESSLLFVVLIVSFGAFHGVLINEWTIILIFGFMAVVMTGMRRRRLAETGRRLGPAG